MKKKLLTFLMIIASAFTLTACSDSEEADNKKVSDTNHADYACYRHEDTVDANGHTNRTYYYINQHDSFDLTFRVNRNHASGDFICGTTIISNDALNYMRYSLIDTKGTTIVDYDKYAYFNRIGSTPYFKFTSTKQGEGEVFYGIFDETGETLIEEKYKEISLFPTDQYIFFLCEYPDGTYDILKEDGNAIIEKIAIANPDGSVYHNRFNNSGKGLFVLNNDTVSVLVSESTGEILATEDNNFLNTLPDYYISNQESGNFELYLISDNNDKVTSMGADFGISHCYAIKDYRYLYDDSGLVTAITDDEGNIKEQPENLLFTPLQIGNTYSMLLEYADKYVMRDSSNKELDKFDKASYTLLSIEEYGVGFQKGDANFVYNFKGDVVLQEVDYDGTYKLKNGRHIIHIPETDKIITSDVCNSYSMLIHDEYHLLQDPELTKYQVLDKDFTLVFEFASEDFRTFIEGTGYDFIVLKDGIYTPTGKKIEAEGLN
jgi:hypothetical protein